MGFDITLRDVRDVGEFLLAILFVLLVMGILVFFLVTAIYAGLKFVWGI